jgi:fumarate reductase flavoprotein subunit
MPDYEPEKKELASRDVVSRRMTEHMRKGKGVKSRYGDHLWLDITILGREHIEKNLREVKEICENFLGIDPAVDWIPVRPTQHYSMGGIRTKYTGESQSMKGLYSCGEAACWDMHGFNRLGGNSVSETVVAGMLVAEYISDFLESRESDMEIHTSKIEYFLQKEQDKIDALLSKENGEDAYVLRRRMEEIMMDKVGIFRNGNDLKEAVDELEELLKRSKNIEVFRSKSPAANPALVNAYRTQKMIKVALTAAMGAYLRTESRGAHSREDFPKRDDENWLKRTITSWPDENQTLPTVNYEEINITTMELPPGFRGYGKDLTTHHPQTASRVSKVEEITKELEEKGASRFEIQEALMPFIDKLPSKYRGTNERFGENI